MYEVGRIWILTLFFNVLLCQNDRIYLNNNVSIEISQLLYLHETRD